MPSATVIDRSPMEGIDDESGEAGRPRRSSAMCEECGESEAKYRCPGCGLRSCSLPCVKSHKERANCSGKRKRTEYVSIADYDDNVLISDYNLLEEMLRQKDVAARPREPLANGRGELQPSLRALQRQAQSRSTSLLLLPQGMSKRKANTSYYEKRTKRIFWRVEWTFEGTGVRVVNQKVDENLSLESILEKHLAGESKDVMMRHRLRNFVWKPINELKLLLPKESCSAAEKIFYELNLKAGLRDQLANKSIIEYPVINVVLPVDAGKYKIEPTLKPIETPKEVIVGSPAVRELEGVPFREEEIEEGEFVP